jgi:YesN/AraC family two-component response regulator
MDKILIIDDEKPTLTMFRLTLSAYGYHVLTAENGNDGLAVFERERPPLVLTDIKMPGMDGIEVLRRIKEIEPKTEVIVITGHGDMDLAIKALNLDATDFLNKPIQRQGLEQALKRARERIELIKSKENQISIEIEDHAAVVHIQGSVTSQCEGPLESVFKNALSAGKDKIIMDFDPNASINGAGIAILTQILIDGQKHGIHVCISGLSDNFKKVFKIVGIFDSKEAALAE